MTQASLKNNIEYLLLWKRLVLGVITISLMYFWYSGMMLHHVYDSPFNYKGSDITYWLYSSTGLTKLLLYNGATALVFSIVLLSFFVLSLMFEHIRWLTIVSGILLLVYQIQFNMKIGYHTHHLFGFQFALLPFYFSYSSFSAALGLARILSCLAYFFAGFFKLYHGAWLSLDSYSHILENQHAAYDYFYQGNLRHITTQYIIHHPSVGLFLFVSAMLLQLSFAVGLLTNKFNKWLALFILIFHLMDWYLMNLGVFMGMTVMVWLFLYKSPTVLNKN